MTDRAPGEVETVARNKPLRVATEDQPAALAMWDAWDRYHSAALDAVRGQSHETGIEAARRALCSGEVDFSPPSFGGDRRKAAELAVDAYLDAVRGRSRDGYVSEVEVAKRVAVMRDEIARLDSELTIACSGRSRDDTVTLAEVRAWLNEEADGFGLMSDSLAYANTGRDAIRGLARKLNARFGAGRAEDET